MVVTSTALGTSTVTLTLESLVGSSPPGGAPDVMNLFYHGTIPEFVLDRVWVVRIDHFKNLLKVVFGWSVASLEIKFGGFHELFVRVLDFLPDTTVVSHCSEAAWMVLLPLLFALSHPFGASDGGIGGYGLATADGHACVNQTKGGPDSLLTRGMSGCDVEQLLGSFWLLMAKLVNQRAARHGILESRDDVSVGHTREFKGC
jgi:hypothetical protein